jgi:hypothetical protein
VKRRRREEIQSKLPSFDTELANNTNRMAQLMKEMEMLRTQSERITEDKARLTRELESLGVDTEGMSHAEMRAKKDEIDHEMSPNPEITTQSAGNKPTPAVDTSTNATGIPQRDAIETEVAPEAITLPEEIPAAEQHAFLPGLGHGLQHNLNGAMAPSQASTVDKTTVANTATDVLSRSLPNNLSQPQEVPTSTKDHSTSVSAAAVPGAQDFATPLDEDDDFYSPAPVAESTLDVNIHSEAHAADDQSLSEEGEIEMSVSSDDEEEEYEPEEPTVITETPMQDAQIPEAEPTTFVVSQDLATEETEDEEAYEPPDVDEGMPDAQDDPKTAGVDVTAPEMEAEDGAMDIASSSSEDSDSDSDSDSGSGSDGEISSESANDGTTIASHALQQIANVSDDLAPELQPESAPAPAPEPVRPPFVFKPS